MIFKSIYRLVNFHLAFLVLIYTLFFPSTSYSQINISEIITKTDTIQDLQKKTSYLLFLSEYFMQDEPDTAISFANRAIKIAVDLQDSSNICDAYKFLSVSHAGNGDCQQSEDCFLTGISYALDAKDSASIYSDMGTSYIICGDLQNAEKCHNIARKLYTRVNDSNNLARLITNMGVMHARNSNYYKASECYLEALDICEELYDEESIAVIYQNMGEVMALQSQFDKAVGYYNSALTLFVKQGRDRQKAAVYLNLGQIYIEQSQWEVAKYFLNKSYVIDTAYNLKNFESLALQLLGITYLRIDKPESAERLIAEALRIQKANGFLTLAGESSYSLAEVYYLQKHYVKAIELLDYSELLADKFSDDKLMAKILSLKSTILAELSRFGEALITLKQSNKISDSIFNIDKANSIMNLEMAYQSEKKEKQIDELKYNDLLHQKQLDKRMAQIYLLIVSIVLLVVILVTGFFLWRKRQQIERKLQEQRFLQGRFEAEERAKDEIARELHDDIGGQLIGITLQLQSSKKISEPELIQLQNVYQDVRRLSHSLDEPLFVDIVVQEKVRNYISEIKEHVSFNIQFIDDLTLKWENIEQRQELQRNIYRIVQELITNTIKYADATDVEIQMMNETNSFVMIYEDNGVGIFSEYLDKDLSFNTIRKRVEMFTGNLEITSSTNQGVFIVITLPVVKKK